LGGGYIYGDVNVGTTTSKASVGTSSATSKFICGGNLKVGFRPGSLGTSAPTVGASGIVQIGDASHPSDFVVGESGAGEAFIGPNGGIITVYHDTFIGHLPNSN